MSHKTSVKNTVKYISSVKEIGPTKTHDLQSHIFAGRFISLRYFLPKLSTHKKQTLPYPYCRETMLTGESRFHISTPWGLKPGPLWREANRWTTGPMELCMDAVKIAGSTQGSPPAADYVGCEAGRRTCRERQTRTGKLCEIKWDYHIVGTTAKWRFGRKPASDEATMINYVGVTNVARQR